MGSLCLPLGLHNKKKYCRFEFWGCYEWINSPNSYIFKIFNWQSLVHGGKIMIEQSCANHSSRFFEWNTIFFKTYLCQGKLKVPIKQNIPIGSVLSANVWKGIVCNEYGRWRKKRNRIGKDKHCILKHITIMIVYNDSVIYWN